MDIKKIIQNKIDELKNEDEPTYCGMHEFQAWEERRDAKIDVLEDLLYEVERLEEKQIN